MRFSTCYALIDKRGFFIFQTFFSYENILLDLLDKNVGTGYSKNFYFLCWCELFPKVVDSELWVGEYGLARIQGLGFFFLRRFIPHDRFQYQLFQNVLRLYLILSYRGRRHVQGLPVRGQRTHSNSWRHSQDRYFVKTNFYSTFGWGVAASTQTRTKIPKYKGKKEVLSRALLRKVKRQKKEKKNVWR